MGQRVSEIMRARWIPRSLVFLVLSLVTCGCAGRGEFGIEEKEKSLRRLGVVQVEGEELEDFFAARVARLVPGLDGQSAVNGGEGASPEPGTRHQGEADFSNGLATAVVRPGYFLTAAHCVAGRDAIWLLGRSEQDRYSGKATVIWISETDDLALLRSEAHSKEFLEFCKEEPKVGSIVLLGGMEGGCSAGRIEKIARSADTGRRILAHSAPGLRGDSGGPLTDRQGRLMGINHRGIWEFTADGVLSSIAAHVDHRLLIELIEKDMDSHVDQDP